MRRVAALALLPALALSVGAARAETLQDALAEAYNTNPQLLAERANLRATDEGVDQALSGWRPTVTFNSAIGAEKAETTGVANINSPAEQTLHPHSYIFTITQPIYNGGGTVAKTAQAEDSVRSERAHLIAVEGTVLFNVIGAYLDVLRDRAVVALDRNNESILQETLKQTQAQFHSGLVTRTDVAQAEARLQAAHALRQQDEGTLQSDRANYTRYVGHAPENLVQPTIRPQIPASRDEALALAATKNPNVISALFGEDAARDVVASTEAQLLPTLSVAGNIQRLQETVVAGREVTSKSVLAQLTIPIYEGGLIYSESRQAKQKVGQSEGLTDDARRFAVEGATAAWETIQAQRANVVSQQAAIKADEIAYEGLQAQQRAGLRTLIDVLNAEQELFSDRTNLVRAQHDLVVAEFNLANQIGRMTAADLKLKVNLYDVNRYYEAVRTKWLGFGPGK